MSRRPALNSAEIRVVALVGVLSLYGLGLQLARLFMRPLELFYDPRRLGFLDGLSFLGSTIAMLASFAFFAFGVIGWSRHRRVRQLATFGIQALAIVVMLLETAGHAYFFFTGSTLDYPLFAYSAGRVRETAMIAAYSLSPPLLWSLGLASFAVVSLPWLIDRRLARSQDPSVPAGARRGFSSACYLSCIVASVPVAALGFLTRTEQAIDRATCRDPLLNIIATLRVAKAPVQTESTGEEMVTLRRSKEPSPLRNVVIVILESTRAASLTPWNPTLQNTPFLAELAARSLRFQRFYTVQTHTSRALQAILCGYEPEHRLGPPTFTRSVASHCLPNLLREQGYRTAHFQTALEQFAHRTFAIFSMGYHDFIGPSRFSHEGFEQPNYLGYEDDSMLSPSRAWLQQQSPNTPFFATYLTVDAHYHCTMLTRHGPQHYSDDDELDCYLNALRADDFFLRALFDQYKAAGLYQNTLFVITADHGEGFGEHSRRTHNDVPYEEALHVPLLVHDPTATLLPPRVRTDPASHLDIAPTVLELLGFSLQSGRYQGSSLLVPHAERPIYAACYDPETCLARVEGNEKFIHHFGRRRDELFDLGRDPGETTNLAALLPQRSAELRRDVLEWDRRVTDAYAAAKEWRPQQASAAR